MLHSALSGIAEPPGCALVSGLLQENGLQVFYRRTSHNFPFLDNFPFLNIFIEIQKKCVIIVIVKKVVSPTTDLRKD